MLLNVISLVMVLAITFLHSIFGFFSGLINVVCSVLSLAIAFGFSEKLNDFATSTLGIPTDYSGPCCLIALFLVSLIVLRTLADNYVRGNVRVPVALDWAGAGACGFINAQILVGVALIAALTLPARSSEKSTLLGFTRWERSPEVSNPDHPTLAGFKRNTLWTRSDEFAVGLFGLISSGSMSGGTTFASVYPDFIDAVYFSANTVQPESSPAAYRDKKIGDGFKDGLKVEQWWEEPGPIEARYRKNAPSEKKNHPDYTREVFKTAPDMKFLGMKLTLRKSSADRDKNSFKHVFRPTMIRLVGQADGKPAQYTPSILANTDITIEGKHRIVDYDCNFAIPGNRDTPIYAYFEVAREFKPAFVEYRRYARAAVGASAEEPPELELTMVTDESKSGPGSGRGKRTFGRVLASQSGDNHKLPFPMSQRSLQRSGDVTLADGQFVSGRVFGSKSRLTRSGSESVVEEFQLPGNRRILQVRYTPKKVRSVVGQVFNFVGQLNQYIIEDTSANEYYMAGYYAIVTRRGEEYVELFFNGDPDNPMDPGYKHMLDFKSLERDEINDSDDTIISLIFVVPRNTAFRKVRNQAGDGGEIMLKTRK